MAVLENSAIYIDSLMQRSVFCRVLGDAVNKKDIYETHYSWTAVGWICYSSNVMQMN